MKIEILPSLLAADYGRLAEEILRAQDAGADALHIDIMDPSFVPNLSFGPDIVALCRKVAPGFYRHVHLMMRRPDLYAARFVECGAQTLQVHIEADCDLHDTLKMISSLGAKPALVLNPETPVERIFPYLDEAKEVLVMTVHPGKGGQSFIREVLPKLEILRRMRPEMDLMVDGGINDNTGKESIAAGANQLVAGSWLFGAGDMKSKIARLRS
ncbi:MAG: ribulose-phosphate 3-epimerase [Kiritimatiellae bacterium]|nr:ribulose-phosphate 3-epimerase [Kiritimatiellia bacterium]